ncbi:MAG: hypothetical protein DRO94_02880 [Candidatus Altiarchaeales archaeon]|nr:MAG: hypothetical protein DRO94_02880 [Candidatus Altiarchaeales archaeon]
MEELLIQNEWWEKEEISKEKALPYKRKIFGEIRDIFLGYRSILVLTGLRRVGKTVLIHQLIEELLKRGVDPKHILYFSFDKLVEEPIEILKAYQRITKIDWRNERVYLFLDEIQKLQDWSSKIKLLYDTLPNLKICISGSASLMVEREAIGNLAGRYFGLEIMPLSLQEFAELYYEEKMDSLELHKFKIDAIFNDYIERPFPEIVKWKSKEKVQEYIRSLVIEKVLGSDIPEVFKRVNISLLKSLAEIFLRNTGIVLNIEDLSKDFHVHKLTLKDHLYYLEFGKLIKIVKNYRPSIMAESRKMPKVYAFHPSLSKAYFAELDKGRMYENLIMNMLKLNNYFRERDKEIDFLKRNREMIPIEVKAKTNVKIKELRNLIWFLKKFEFRKGLVIYEGEKRKEKINNMEIDFIPIKEILF